MKELRLKNLIKQSFFVLVIFIFLSCQSNKSYDKMLADELSTGIRNDSIFFGINFGDSRRTFFDKCWEQNSKGILYHGASNQTVQYTIEAPNDSVSNILMKFYPDFRLSEDLRKMDITFSFTGWALWNESLHAVELVPYVSDLLSNWYGGNSFYILTKDDGTNALVKIDGNREIKIWYTGNHYVNVSITDKSYGI